MSKSPILLKLVCAFVVGWIGCWFAVSAFVGGSLLILGYFYPNTDVFRPFGFMVWGIYMFSVLGGYGLAIYVYDKEK